MQPLSVQTLQRMVLDAKKKEGWTHGHLYVPISRVPRASGCKIVPHRTGTERDLIRNVVYKEVLDREDLCEATLQRVQRPPPPPPQPPPPAPPTTNDTTSS